MLDPGKPTRRRTGNVGWRVRLGFLREGAATQLLEFALMLPLLVVLAVGIFDFGSAFNLRQKLTNAAREGARIAISQSTADLTQPTPGTVQAVGSAVVNYLTNENVATSFIGTTPTKTGALEWTYSSTISGNPVLVIDRGATIPVTVNGVTTLIVATRVTLNYPYSWSFNRIIRLLVPSASFAGSFVISTVSVMKNLT